ELVRPDDRIEDGVLLSLVLDVRLVSRVEVVESRHNDADVRRYAGAARTEPVLLTVTWSAHYAASHAFRMRIARRIERKEAVAPDASRVVRDERVLASPARPVARVVRIDVDEPAVTVGGSADTRRSEAVDRPTFVGVAPEDLVEASAVNPVRPRFEPRGRAGPV